MKTMTIAVTIALAAAWWATPAPAGDLRDLCAERPGLDTPACTVDARHLQLEVGVADWTLDRRLGSRTDTIVAGDLLARYGLGGATELRLGWTSYGHVRTRDGGAVDRSSGIGDISVGVKRNLVSPSGDGLSIALLPSASIPVGARTIGAGAWGASLLVPASYDLVDTVSLLLTPEIDAAPDGDRHGRHLAYGSAAGLGFKLTGQASASAEVQLIRDHDPEDHSTQALAGVYLAYQPQDRTQFDVGAQAGINHATADVELYFGVTHKF